MAASGGMTVGDALALALDHHRAGRHEAAEGLYRAILAAVPDLFDARNLLGALRLERGDAAAAAALLRDATVLDPGAAAAWANGGNALRALGRAGEGLVRYGRALAVRPGHPGAARGRAALLQALGRTGEARDAWRDAVVADPLSVEARTGLGEAGRALGTEAEAAGAFAAAVALRPDRAAPLVNRAVLFLDADDPAAAAPLLRRALVLEPGLAAARGALAEALLRLGRAGGAVAVLRPALAGDPAAGADLHRMAAAAFAAGDAAAGAAWYRRAAHLAGRTPGHLQPARIVAAAEQAAVAGHPYHRVLPERTVSVRAGFHRWDTVTFRRPELFLTRVNDALVLPSNLAVLAGPEALLLDGLHAYSRSSLTLLPDYALHTADDRVLLDLGAERRADTDEAVLLGGSGNFAHDVLDWLSRLLVLERFPELAALPLLVAPALHPAAVGLLGRLGVDPGRLAPLPAGAPARVRRLWLPSLTHAFQYMAPEYAAFLRERLGIPPLRRPGRRLYLSRRGAGHRAVLNEAAILDALAGEGVERFEPAGMGMAEQLRILGEAELIVGPVGGGFAAIVFAPAGCGVVELTHGRCVLPQYGILAGLIGQPYRQVVGEAAANRGALAFDCDFTVEPAAVRDAVKRVVGA